MSKIVTMYRGLGDALTRMKSEYVNTGSRDGSMSTILVPDGEAHFFERFGLGFDVRDNLAPQEVFGEDFDISLVLAENLPAGFENREETIKNQNEATIDKVSDNLYLIEADFTDMVKYTSTDPNQAALGKFYWLGVVVDTGKETIIGSQFNGYTFVQADVDEATSVGAPAGSFILWLKLERGNRTFILKSGDKETAITLKIVNTAVEDVVPPYMQSAVVSFDDDVSVEFVGKNVTVLQGSEVSDIRVELNEYVQLSGTPKAMFVVEDGVDLEYGAITIDELGVGHSIVITPTGGMGVSSNLGVHKIRIPANSVRHRGVGNADVIINVTVVVTPDIEAYAAAVHFAEGESVQVDDGVFTFDAGRTITAIDILFNQNVVVGGTPEVTFTVAEGTPIAFGTLGAHPTAAYGARIVPTGTASTMFNSATVGTLSIPASALSHRGVSSGAMSYGVVVE